MWAGAAIGAPARADATDAHGGATASRSRSDGVTLLRYRERTDDATTDRDSAPPGDRRGHPGSTPGCVDGTAEAGHRHVRERDGLRAMGHGSEVTSPRTRRPRRLRPRWYQSLDDASPIPSLVEDGYTIWYVMRRQGMPQGHSIADMADDFAEFIETELGGRVDAVLGTSYGGIEIGFHLAARHPDRWAYRHRAGRIRVQRAWQADSTTRSARSASARVDQVEAAKGMFEDYFPHLPCPRVGSPVRRGDRDGSVSVAGTPSSPAT